MLKFKLPTFSTFMNKPSQIRLLKTPTILFVIGAILSLMILITILTLPTSIFSWNEFSELIPVIAKVDSTNQLQLENQLFLIRQSYSIQYVEVNADFNILGYLFSIVGLGFLLIGFQRWSRIQSRQFIFGIVLWLGIVAYNNSNHTVNDWILLFQQQIAYVGIIAVFIWSILSSQAVPSFLIQLGFQLEQKNNVKIWMILGLFYFVNILLSLGNLLNFWESNLLLPTYFFWMFSSLLFLIQIMKFQNRTQQILYFGLFLLVICTFFLMYVHHNDPGIKALETWNMMTQIIMVVIFPAFIYTNFKELITVHLPIFKVFHKAQKLPIYLIHVGVFLLASTWVFALNTAVFHQIMAAKSNQDGDNAYLLKEFTLAEIQYKNALTHSKLNLKSNICLAHLAQQKNAEEEQAYYLSNTLVKNPQAETFIALSHLFAKNDHLFESLFNLKKGLNELPDNRYLLNQLAINYEKLNLLDSAQYFYQKAYELASEDEIALANYLYFECKYPQVQINQALLNLPESKNKAIQNNALVYASLHHSTLPAATISKDFEPKIDVRDWALLYNTSSLFREKAPLFAYSQWKENRALLKFFPELAFLEAWQNYYHQKPLQGLDQLSLIIAQDTSAKTKGFQNILGYWKEKALKSIPNLSINSLQSAKKALENYPFHVGILQRSIPILNQNSEEKLAYHYALSALRYNEKIADFYPIYAYQALEMAEIQYAKEAMESLKNLDPLLYQKEKNLFEIKLQKVLEKQRF